MSLAKYYKVHYDLIYQALHMQELISCTDLQRVCNLLFVHQLEYNFFLHLV